MKRVIVDTNMLLVPGQHKVDIFTEIDRVLDEPYTIEVLEGSLRELAEIASGKTGASADDRRAAKLAAMLLEHQRKRDWAASSESRCKGLKILSRSAEQHVDDAILAIADDALVATNDGGLKRRLLERGTRVIFLKQRQYLALSE